MLHVDSIKCLSETTMKLLIVLCHEKIFKIRFTLVVHNEPFSFDLYDGASQLKMFFQNKYFEFTRAFSSLSQSSINSNI